MTDKPIIFSGPMVRAIIEGRKTQTRRVLRAKPGVTIGDIIAVGDVTRVGIATCYHGSRDQMAVPYAPGDRLWVREACRAEELSEPPGERPATKAEREKLGRTRVPVMSELDGADGVRYLADDSWSIIENSPTASDRWIDLFHYRGRGKGGVGNNVPPIHMPRWASRLTLTVTEVRVQRLQEISYLDTCAEGVDCETCAAMGQSACYRKGCGASREAFRVLWNSLHGPDAWGANPWVVAVSFTVEHRNIDAPRSQG